MGSGQRTELGPREQALARRLGRRSIVLVGMPGAGKSAVGKRLAARLGLSFRDADAEIEAAAHKTIPEIFEQDGEPFFRDKERRVIERLLCEDVPIVLATGGGAFMHAQTRQTIRACAVSIWLQTDLDVLLKRVRKKTNRPLLRVRDPEATLKALLEARGPVYAEADIVIHSRDVAHEVVLDEVVEAVENLLAAVPA